nr:hypothetical protein [Tanacetum cinerariifolium]
MGSTNGILIPLAATPATRTMPQRMAISEEEVYGLHESLGWQREVFDAMTLDFSRFTTWTVSHLSQLLDERRITYTSYASESYAQFLEIDNLKHTLFEHLKEKESLEKMVTLHKNDFQKEESRNIDRELALEKQAQQLEPKLYDGSVIQKTNAIVICDSEETLMLEDESRSKILQKQKDPMMSEKKVNTKPVDYAAINQLSHDFEARVVPQTELSAEQVFWSQNLRNSEEFNLSTSTTIVEVPKELPKVSMVNSSLKKLKFHLASFDMVVKEKTIATAITEDKIKDVLKENERLLEQAISTDIVNIVVNANVNYAYQTVNECERCVTIETELQRDYIKKECYDKLFKQYTTLKKHCISLEVDTQLEQGIFQRNNSVSQQSAPTFDQLFKINDLKAQSKKRTRSS